MANKLLKKDKIKYICGVHCSDIIVLKDLKYLFFRNALKNAYKNADKIAARSPVLKNKIENIIPNSKNKTFIAYSGIESELIEKTEEKLFNKEKIEISTAASLIKRKNVDIIIKALFLINKDLRRLIGLYLVYHLHTS
jgi:glycosyltransferase involved in cell wall biosynthesis